MWSQMIGSSDGICPWLVRNDVSWRHLVGNISDCFAQGHSTLSDDWIDKTLTSIHLIGSCLHKGVLCSRACSSLWCYGVPWIEAFCGIQTPSCFPSRSFSFSPSFPLHDPKYWKPLCLENSWACSIIPLKILTAYLYCKDNKRDQQGKVILCQNIFFLKSRKLRN